MSYSSEVLADSPILYDALDETSGTVATDSSTVAHNGTIRNAPTLSVAPLILTGTSITFNGSSQDIEFTAVASYVFSTSNRISVEAWIKTSVGTGIQSIIIGDDTGGTRIFQFTVNAGKLQFIVFKPGGTNISILGSTTISDGVKHHVVGTFDGTNLNIYVDGNSDATPAALGGTISTGTPHIEIAARLSSGSRSSFFNGTIDEVAVYNTLLSTARILAHYTTGLGIDFSTISSTTSVTTTETRDSVEATTISGKTSVSASEIYTPFGTIYTDSSVISTKTNVSYVEVAPYTDLATVTSRSTPDVIVEVASTTIIDITASGSPYVGSTITMSVSVEVTADGTVGTGTGSGGTVTGDITYSPAGDWGFSSDDDNGLIP